MTGEPTHAPPTKELEAWGEVRVVREIPHSNRASRTWLVQLNEQAGVAKLTFDRVEFVEPGLRVAGHVQNRTGVLTGRPLASSSGTVVVPVAQPDGSTWTLAVLEFVSGDPVVAFDKATALEAGCLLGRVHQALTKTAAPPAVPARLLDWYRTVGDAYVLGVVADIEQLRLTGGVVYGDPSPELIRRDDGSLALIDWGTPSAGPFMHDLATWETHVHRYAEADGNNAAAALRAGYFTTGPCAARETRAVEPFNALWRWTTSDQRSWHAST